MALIADFSEMFGANQRYFHLAGFSVDRLSGTTTAKFNVYASAEARAAYKAAVLEEQRAMAAIEEKQASYPPNQNIPPAEIGPFHDALMAARSKVEANAPKAGVDLTIAGVNVDTVTIPNIYTAAGAIMPNSKSV